MVRKTTDSVDKFRAMECHKSQAGSSHKKQVRQERNFATVLLKIGGYPSTRETYAFFLLRAKENS
jgi:hypothetical protein